MAVKRFKNKRNPEYLQWIREQPCMICGQTAEPAHVKSRGAGGEDVGNVVSLCRLHHRQQHDIGIKSFETLWKIDLKQAALDYATIYGTIHGRD